jgi:hypothetical protein
MNTGFVYASVFVFLAIQLIGLLTDMSPSKMLISGAATAVIVGVIGAVLSRIVPAQGQRGSPPLHGRREVPPAQDRPVMQAQMPAVVSDIDAAAQVRGATEEAPQKVADTIGEMLKS